MQISRFGYATIKNSTHLSIGFDCRLRDRSNTVQHVPAIDLIMCAHFYNALNIINIDSTASEMHSVRPEDGKNAPYRNGEF